VRKNVQKKEKVHRGRIVRVKGESLEGSQQDGRQTNVRRRSKTGEENTCRRRVLATGKTMRPRMGKGEGITSIYIEKSILSDLEKKSNFGKCKSNLARRGRKKREKVSRGGRTKNGQRGLACQPKKLSGKRWERRGRKEQCE